MAMTKFSSAKAATISFFILGVVAVLALSSDESTVLYNSNDGPRWEDFLGDIKHEYKVFPTAEASSVR